MINGSIVLVRGNNSEDLGAFTFGSMPSPAARIMVAHNGVENYATVISVHHYPVPAGSGEPPSAEIVAKWTGSGKKLR